MDALQKFLSNFWSAIQILKEIILEVMVHTKLTYLNLIYNIQ